jgi:hypothetical protein
LGFAPHGANPCDNLDLKDDLLATDEQHRADCIKRRALAMGENCRCAKTKIGRTQKEDCLEMKVNPVLA